MLLILYNKSKIKVDNKNVWGIKYLKDTDRYYYQKFIESFLHYERIAYKP